MQAETEIDTFNALLAQWRNGDDKARDTVIAMVHREVEAIASIVLRRHHAPRSIVTGDLVNEAMLQLIQSDDLRIENRAHLMALCARIMRFLLIDEVRRRAAQKRNHETVTLSTSFGASEDMDVDVMALSEALLRLQAIAPDRARIVEMRYFGGMTLEDIGEVMGVSEATVKRSWRITRAWLKEAIENDLG